MISDAVRPSRTAIVLSVSIVVLSASNEDDPFAVLCAVDALGDELARVRVAPGYRLDARTASAWIAADFRRPD